MKVLLVEDYTPLCEAVSQGLREEGFAVDVATDGDTGLWHATASDYDVVILDLMLPGMDGLTVLKRLRKSGRDTHVLILTAKDTTEDRVRGLDLGADDYLVKPFAFRELLARVRALVRRKYHTKDPTLRVADLEIDTTARTVRRAGRRIELSPRFLGVVKWIGVRKGDTVTNGQVVVLLDDAEYKARLKEAEGRLAGAKASVEKAELDYGRAMKLSQDRVESKEAEDAARIRLDSARAAMKEIEGQYDLARTYLDWTVIRSPINGVVLEKLVDPDELVVPQSFGGTRGPSTALISVADPRDLQVEIELNEANVAKAFLGQKCRVSPEAYPEKTYQGYVVEMAPEANRQKGTLEVKVQIRNPDRFLTPELSAKVDFLADDTTPALPSSR